MSYQVLARKYRPQVFEEVVGQRHVTQTLQNALKLQRIHHAYLFTGARGVGKTTVARILAKALNCEKGVKENPCNQCGNCLEILEGKSLDVQEIDGASNTGVDDVRQIREQVKYLPAKGRYKVYIIDEVHMLSNAAFNALLKTLEEPPKHVIFVFATTEAHKIPATILSRCQRYDFRRIPMQELIHSLTMIAKEEGISGEEEAWSLIAREAEGSLRDAQSLLDQAIAFGGKTIDRKTLEAMFGILDRDQLWGLSEAILSRNRTEALTQLDAFFQTGTDLHRLAQDLLLLLRHLLLLKALGERPSWLEVSKEEWESLEKLASGLSLEECDQWFELMFRGVEEIARSNFPKMVFEVLLIRMMQVGSLIPIQQILDRLETLNLGEEIPSIPPSKSPPLSKTWGHFVEWLSREKPQLSSILQHGEFIEMNASQVTLAFQKDSVWGEMLSEMERRQLLESLLRQFFGSSYGLQIITASPKDTDLNLQKKEKEKDLKRQALEHPSVKEAREIFGAIVEEVKTDEPH